MKTQPQFKSISHAKSIISPRNREWYACKLIHPIWIKNTSTSVRSFPFDKKIKQQQTFNMENRSHKYKYKYTSTIIVIKAFRLLPKRKTNLINQFGFTSFVFNYCQSTCTRLHIASAIIFRIEFSVIRTEQHPQLYSNIKSYKTFAIWLLIQHENNNDNKTKSHRKKKNDFSTNIFVH